MGSLIWEILVTLAKKRAPIVAKAEAGIAPPPR